MFRAVVPAALLAVALLPTSAQAAPSPFEVVKTTKLRGHDQLTQIVAPARNSAFAFGHRGDKVEQPIAYHYDGKSWRADAMPKGVKGSVSGASASSAKDAWAAIPGNSAIALDYLGSVSFSLAPDCPDEDYRIATAARPGGIPLVTAARAAAANGRAAEQPSRLLRWNGKKWTVAKTFRSAAIAEVLTLGPKNVWAFGIDRRGPATWHFTGKTWKRTANSMIVGAVAKGPGGTLWGLSLGRDGYQIARFNGRRWETRTPKSVPALVKPAPDRPWVVPMFGQPLRSGGRMYFSMGAMRATGCDETTFETALLSWDGRKWRSEAYPAKLEYLAAFGEAVTADGRGGFYTLASDHSEDHGILLHRTAKGRWSSRQLPGGRDAPTHSSITLIPGTTSLWSVGVTTGGWDSDGFIARKGKK